MNLHRYITTPIYYANGSPHAGHVYATILASILKNHYTHRGMQVKLLTGLDEHGEAVQDKAKELGLTPQAHVDNMAQEWKNEFAKFEVNYDIFLRTTDSNHVTTVQEILNYCYKKNDIYFGEHEGHYCIKCEGFLNSSERDENNNCLIHKRPTELRKEKNYFFRTTKYREALRTLILEGKITQQQHYIHELVGMLDALEGDLSISRPKTRLQWGIELPFDKEHVAYVWFDALPNYITGIGGLEAARTNEFWKNSYHILGKDILKFHGIFWPAMCLSLNIPTPKLLITGWLLKDSHKMSKSLGNVITAEQIFHFGRDMFTNYVFRMTNPGDDIDISWKVYFERFNSDLANGIGNLYSRVYGMIEKYFDKKIPQFNNEYLLPQQKEIQEKCEAAVQNVEKHFDNFKLADALAEIWNLISITDKHITEQKPWNIAKKNDSESIAQLGNILATSIAVLRVVAYLSHSFFSTKMNEVLTTIGENTSDLNNFFSKAKNFKSIQSGFIFNEPAKLYARLDIPALLAEVGASLEPSSSTNSVSSQVIKPIKTAPVAKPQDDTSKANDDNAKQQNEISIQEFSKVEMHVGTVITAEHVEGSDKLLKLIVSLGQLGERQVFSGIREWVKPEEVVNRKVVIVTNLTPRKMKFGLSEGMMLSTETVDGKICPIYLPESLKEGAKLS